jgi:hypothetical protein
MPRFIISLRPRASQGSGAIQVPFILRLSTFARRKQELRERWTKKIARRFPLVSAAGMR